MLQRLLVVGLGLFFFVDTASGQFIKHTPTSTVVTNDQFYAAYLFGGADDHGDATGGLPLGGVYTFDSKSAGDFELVAPNWSVNDVDWWYLLDSNDINLYPEDRTLNFIHFAPDDTRTTLSLSIRIFPCVVTPGYFGGSADVEDDYSESELTTRSVSVSDFLPLREGQEFSWSVSYSDHTGGDLYTDYASYDWNVPSQLTVVGSSDTDKTFTGEALYVQGAGSQQLDCDVTYTQKAGSFNIATGFIFPSTYIYGWRSEITSYHTSVKVFRFRIEENALANFHIGVGQDREISSELEPALAGATSWAASYGRVDIDPSSTSANPSVTTLTGVTSGSESLTATFVSDEVFTGIEPGTHGVPLAHGESAFAILDTQTVTVHSLFIKRTDEWGETAPERITEGCTATFTAYLEPGGVSGVYSWDLGPNLTAVGPDDEAVIVVQASDLSADTVSTIQASFSGTGAADGLEVDSNELDLDLGNVDDQLIYAVGFKFVPEQSAWIPADADESTATDWVCSGSFEIYVIGDDCPDPADTVREFSLNIQAYPADFDPAAHDPEDPWANGSVDLNPWAEWGEGESFPENGRTVRVFKSPVVSLSGAWFAENAPSLRYPLNGKMRMKCCLDWLEPVVEGDGELHVDWGPCCGCADESDGACGMSGGGGFTARVGRQMTATVTPTSCSSDEAADGSMPGNRLFNTPKWISIPDDDRDGLVNVIDDEDDVPQLFGETGIDDDKDLVPNTVDPYPYNPNFPRRMIVNGRTPSWMDDQPDIQRPIDSIKLPDISRVRGQSLNSDVAVTLHTSSGGESTFYASATTSTYTGPMGGLDAD